MAAMLGVASGRVIRSFEIQVAKAKNGQKNDSAEESTTMTKPKLVIKSDFESVLNKTKKCCTLKRDSSKSLFTEACSKPVNKSNGISVHVFPHLSEISDQPFSSVHLFQIYIHKNTCL